MPEGILGHRQRFPNPGSNAEARNFQSALSGRIHLAATEGGNLKISPLKAVTLEVAETFAERHAVQPPHRQTAR
jgi:hypothetical protein